IFEYSNFCNVKSSEKSFVGLDIYDKTDRARASRLPSHFRADFSPSFPPAAPTGRDMTAMHTVATIFYEL
ncbi:hypothetical protein, partial [Alistipes putredinis]|uniref:hypothetical protein n=1 Tax=Alistipes putredinis TaxID=28117 RepID=UPI003AB6F08A